MTRTFLRIGALVMSLFCTGIADYNLSSPEVYDSADLLEMKDIVFHLVHDYLQRQEKRLTTFRKLIEDHSKELEKGIRNVVRNVSAVTQKSPTNDDEKIEEEANKDDLSDLSEHAASMYEEYCTQKVLLSANILKQLKCRYVDRGIPFLKLAPFKEEEAYLEPRIVIYHDVIYEEELEVLKRLSKPKLEAAKLRNHTSEKDEVSKERVTKIAWLSDNDSKHVNLLSQRVEHMTGLTVDTAEKMQIAYYGIGGFYDVHLDFEDRKRTYFFTGGTGNRIATVLFYLNDVEKGGGTVFPNLNLTIWPRKGSAAFWYNLKRNGEGDYSTLHGACPVLSGTKWIMTKWLRESGQEFLRPCTLLENE